MIKMISRQKAGMLTIAVFLSALGAPAPSAAQETFMAPSGQSVKAPASYAGEPYVVEAPVQDPDPGTVFFLPAAGTLSKGQVGVGLLRSIGFGVYVGATDCLTIGVGMLPTLSVQLEVKWSIIKTPRHMLSLWGFFHYPFLITIYKAGDGGDYMDGGFMYSGGILYAFQGERFETKIGLLYHDFVMYDKYRTCRGTDCVDDTNFYHKWIMFSPYIEVGYRVAKQVKLMALLTSFDISTTTVEKVESEDSVSASENKSFFWQDLIVMLGVRYFRKIFVLDVGIAIPIVPSYMGGEGYPYVLPVAGVSWVK